MASLAEVRAETELLIGALTKIPVRWDGKAAIQSMKDAGDRHWRQTEWIGFFGEFIVRPLLAQLHGISVPGERFGKVSFDIGGVINWDLKTHPNSSKVAILNDRVAVLQSIERHGYHGFIVLAADCEFDDNSGSFKKWHDDLKGKTSPYVINRIRRGAPSRRRKTNALVRALHFLVVDKASLSIFGSAQEGWRNSNGAPRRAKFSISHSTLVKESRTINLPSE